MAYFGLWFQKDRVHHGRLNEQEAGWQEQEAESSQPELQAQSSEREQDDVRLLTLKPPLVPDFLSKAESLFTSPKGTTNQGPRLQMPETLRKLISFKPVQNSNIHPRNGRNALSKQSHPMSTRHRTSPTPFASFTCLDRAHLTMYHESLVSLWCFTIGPGKSCGKGCSQGPSLLLRRDSMGVGTREIQWAKVCK